MQVLELHGYLCKGIFVKDYFLIQKQKFYVD